MCRINHFFTSVRSELQTEVDSNRQNEKQIKKLERECVRCKYEIQTLNAKEDIRNNKKHISNIERNFPDLYNSDDNMATIAQLVDAINGFVDNRVTVRDILIGQIKDATKQICIKNNNLQWDLREVKQARTQLQTDLGNTIGDLHQLLDRIARKQTCIGVLVQEKFALQLLYQRNVHHLQRSRRDIGLLEFNRDRLYERYEKWKNKTQVERQNNLKLQKQILALQNNPLNIQQIGMVGYGPLIFYGYSGEDLEDWLKDIQASGREEAFGLVVSCLAGDALNLYNTHVNGKNWRCNNLSDNLGVATLTAVRGLVAKNGGEQIGVLNTAREFQGKAAAKIGRIGAGIATSADIIPNDNAPVAPNAGGSLPVVIIAPGIKLGQLLYLFRTAYMTVEHLK
ncbi:hypothetical protein RhiirC2_795748 [Rhizophagus irregularis]|uniref:Uncharacterized protein n=1 Tax=Rhizophagus irregularis TaxID=588596 RepID=A0A2N1MAY8_9GLOM|nr:hypothetical protein RhiirC2_795748 [Rhizophagus irregularis]